MATGEDSIVIRVNGDELGEGTSEMTSDSVIKEATSSGVATHQIKFRGMAGIIFWLLVVGTTFCLISYAGVGWSENSPMEQEEGDSVTKVGLWQTCQCNPGFKPFDKKASFEAVQAMITIGMIGFLAAVTCAALYLSSFSAVSKTTAILLVMGCSFFCVVFMFIGIVIYAAEMPGDHSAGWPLYLSSTATVCSFLAGVCTLVQYRRATRGQ